MLPELLGSLVCAGGESVWHLQVSRVWAASVHENRWLWLLFQAGLAGTVLRRPQPLSRIWALIPANLLS